MGNIFRDYAEFYDLLYRDKEYRKEAEYVASLIARYAPRRRRPAEILDLACGTGRHAVELVRLGFRVDGSDPSAEMVRKARESARLDGHTGRFFRFSFRDADRIAKSYDAVISMFSAINYIVEYDELARALRNIHGLLRSGGIFIFDYWNGNAVLRDYSPVRVIRKKEGDRAVRRTSRTEVDAIQQRARVKFTFDCLKKGRKRVGFDEVHELRYFHFKEIETYLGLNGFDLVYRSPFLELDAPVDPYVWNVSVVAKKRGRGGPLHRKSG